ncbi:MAG: GSCFA domain-containing protein [Prevotella sp.]|nr:GSCFA domain-containing protein [Prevotella sp.]
MEFRTRVEITPAAGKIEPCTRMLFVGSCFAGNIGELFRREAFPVVVNPYGVMYNPVSVLHSVRRFFSDEDYRGFRPDVTVLSLGTNRVYVDKATGLIVDNCRKRPAADFEEKELDVSECAGALVQAADVCGSRVIVTVSPIRYKKYGFHASQLSKAVLLLAADRFVKTVPNRAEYFPSYEIINDELRDYRFYEPDMLHPSRQAAEYIFARFADTYFSERTFEFLRRWQPLRDALAHRPKSPESDEYKAFIQKTRNGIEELKEMYPGMAIPDFSTGDNQY